MWQTWAHPAQNTTATMHSSFMAPLSNNTHLPSLTLSVSKASHPNQSAIRGGYSTWSLGFFSLSFKEITTEKELVGHLLHEKPTTTSYLYHSTHAGARRQRNENVVEEERYARDGVLGVGTWALVLWKKLVNENGLKSLLA
jgi:hypothetical protein